MGKLTVCDRCGKVIEDERHLSSVFFKERIVKGNFTLWKGYRRSIEIELCPSCCRELEDWIMCNDEVKPQCRRKQGRYELIQCKLCKHSFKQNSKSDTLLCDRSWTYDSEGRKVFRVVADDFHCNFGRID